MFRLSKAGAWKLIESLQEFLPSASRASTALSAICDSKLKILNLNARYPGSTHDSFIWKSSAVRRSFMQQYHEAGSWLLGDSGYPLEPSVTPSESAYNRTHIAARNVIERCNGVLKACFRCLLRSRELNYTPTKAGKIACACAVLHNMCKYFDLSDPPPKDDARIPWGPISPTQEDSNLRNL